MNSSEQTYWNNFYNNSTFIVDIPSDFCNFVIEYFNTNKSIKNVIDCGCGNGRDSYKLSNKYNVCGIDNSGFKPINTTNVIFEYGNFINLDKKKYDLVYSRFTFHSITDEQQLLFLNSINSNTYLAIETRSDKGLNEDVYHGKTHFRNYTNLDYLKKILIDNKFDILFIDEGINMAIYKDENPICIRVICKKQ